RRRSDRRPAQGRQAAEPAARRRRGQGGRLRADPAAGAVVGDRQRRPDAVLRRPGVLPGADDALVRPVFAGRHLLPPARRALAVSDPAAVLVSPRVLRRIVQAELQVPYLLTQVPHENCYFFDRQVLFRHVEQDELGLEPDHLLPPTVILLARPTAEQVQALK